MSRRVHLDGTPEGGLPQALCGIPGGNLSRDAAAVTCRLCQRRAKALALAIDRETALAIVGPEHLDPLPYTTPGTAELEPASVAIVERLDALDRGDDVNVEQEPRWSSIDRAVEHLFRVLDDGAPVRSSFRAEAPVQSSGGTASATTGREDVLAVMRAIDAAYDTQRVFGDLVLSVEVQRQILEWRMVGRPVDQATAPGRKGKIRRRVGVTHEELAAALERETGMRVTARHVQLVEGAGREAVYQRLVDAGEVREMRGDRIPFDALVGLAEIASVLGVTPATAARYVDSAPTRRAFRRGRVTHWTHEAELRTWMERTRGPWTWEVLGGA
ncbi:hypothetical protein [Sandaracinus amylolyticus]|uniref:Helix-turn-helix domain-containing protein n=1 Tax=Sandaracinus amylolyticus TaxID=927083 RepID=A0A0F6W6S5_9BACT|nr:hypothetical protein [Sandaracinus amylolyticus]AKF08873.1 hypothetical protein DB32_006022 [Sandaracinus amylolyticus]